MQGLTFSTPFPTQLKSKHEVPVEKEVAHSLYLVWKSGARMPRLLAIRLPRVIAAVAEVATAAATLAVEVAEATVAKVAMAAMADRPDTKATGAKVATQEAIKAVKAAEEAAEAMVTLEATREVATVEVQAEQTDSLVTRDAAVVAAPIEVAAANLASAAMKVATSNTDRGHHMSLSNRMMAFSRLNLATIEVAAVVAVATTVTTTTVALAAEEAATPSAEAMARSTVTQVNSGSSIRPKAQQIQQPLKTLEPSLTSLQRESLL